MFVTIIESRVPMLADCAASDLAEPAGAAPSEATFSVLNLVVTKLRCGLNRERASKLTQSALRFKRAQSKLKRSNSAAKALKPFPPFGKPVTPFKVIDHDYDDDEEYEDDGADDDDYENFERSLWRRR